MDVSHLTPDVPDEKGEPAGPAEASLHSLAVETHSGDRVHVLVELESVQCRGLPRPIQSNHHNMIVLLVYITYTVTPPNYHNHIPSIHMNKDNL